MTDLREDLDVLIMSSPVLMLQFGEDTCGPCRAIRQKLDRWLEGQPGVCARYVDIPSHLELCSQRGIFAAPAVLVYMDGHLAAREAGVFSLEELLARIERYMVLRCDGA